MADSIQVSAEQMEEVMSGFMYEALNVPCVRYERMRKPDGEGGYIETWTETEKFMASLSMDTSTQAEIAKKLDVKSIFKVTLPRGLFMDYHDVFKRLSDGQVFRVTTKSNDNMTPDFASISFSQVKAEEWEL